MGAVQPLGNVRATRPTGHLADGGRAIRPSKHWKYNVRLPSPLFARALAGYPLAERTLASSVFPTSLLTLFTAFALAPSGVGPGVPSSVESLFALATCLADLL